MLKLRDYQQELVGAIHDAWQSLRSVLAVLPTGGGKTVIFSYLMQTHKGASAAIAHRREILGQISLSLASLGVKHRVVAPPATVKRIRRRHIKKFGANYIDPTAVNGVISVQTLTSKSSAENASLQAWINQLTLVVFDEGHHYVDSGIWGRAVEMMHRAKLLFVTATPERADGKGLGVHSNGYCETMVEGPTTAWLIEQGHLSRFAYKAPESDLNVADLAVDRNGDFNAKALRNRVVESHLVGDTVQHYLQYANGLKTIVFATDVSTANEMAVAFTAAGVKAKALSAKTDGNERDAALDEFETSNLNVLVNVDLFDEGFDVPAVACAILARPTQSLAKFLQMVGRALRTMEGKEQAIIIDAVRNWERHGMPNWPRNWTLDARPKGNRNADDTVLQRICTACTQPYEAYYRECPYCGEPYHVEGGVYEIEKVDGDLIDLDVDALAALFAKIEEAERTDEQFEIDLIGSKIPVIGRPRLLKAHQAARYRRDVLRNLVGWWIGCQPEGRDIREKYRRFYHRFGIDIATAFTLSADDTDKLVDRITERFNEDMLV